jgi:integrase/recombinase XerD
MNRFDEFVRERRYLRNVSPATVSWYTHAFHWLPLESPTQDEQRRCVADARKGSEGNRLQRRHPRH